MYVVERKILSPKHWKQIENQIRLISTVYPALNQVFDILEKAAPPVNKSS